ncbi:MAG: hypothetical protein WCA51_01830 [Dehalococcoidia bacterium]
MSLSSFSRPALIDQLLEVALSENISVKVESSSFNIDAGSCTASAVFLKIGGTISNLNTSKHTLTLTYQSSKTINIDFSNAQTNDRVKGQLINGVFVATKLNGYDGKEYFAYQVETADLLTED